MMDRQQNSRKEIPVNARAVGNPMGINVLYMEDYVHTFIKKIVKNDVDGNGCEVFLYGYEFDEDGKHFFVVSSAYQLESRYDRPEKIGVKFFPESHYLGTANIHSDGVSQMNMEMVREGTRNIVFNNFYIYYDQNDEMQNYLIDWNMEHREYSDRIEREDSVRYGRIAQAHNKEEVRVSFLWNAMNVLSMGFVVCVAVYGITSINNYHKMKNMEDKISYIVTAMTENQNFIAVSGLSSGQSEDEMYEEAGVFRTDIIEESVDEEIETVENTVEAESIVEEKITMAESVSTEIVQVEQAMGSGLESTAVEEAIEVEMTEVSEDVAAVGEMATIPQYYVVQQGDTLRSICISVYGNLERVEEVCLHNGITDPDSILCGQTLLLP